MANRFSFRLLCMLGIREIWIWTFFSIPKCIRESNRSWSNTFWIFKLYYMTNLSNNVPRKSCNEHPTSNRIKKQKHFCIIADVEYFRPLCLRELLLASSRNCRYIMENNCNNQSCSRFQIRIAFRKKWELHYHFYTSLIFMFPIRNKAIHIHVFLLFLSSKFSECQE